MKKFKRLFEDVPLWLNIFNIIFITIWTLADAYIVTALSKLTASVMAGEAELIKTIIFFVLFIVGWELTEFVGDTASHISATHIENNAFSSHFEKLYTTNPEALKKANTGYIAGVLHKMIHKKEKAYQSVTQFLMMAAVYITYLVLYAARFSIWFSVAISIITLLSILIRIAAVKITKEKRAALVDAEGHRTKIFMDATTNMATVQKLRGLEFIKGKIKVINRNCLIATKRFFYTEEFSFCLYKTLMYMVCPVCLIILLLLGDDVSFDRNEFLAFLAITEVKLVHYGKNVANAIKDYSLWTPAQEKLDKLISLQSKMYTSTSIGDNFESIEIKDIEYQYMDNNKKSVKVNIPHFQFNKGDFVCVCGESGQGKTTTLNILSGAIESDGVYIDGKPMDKNIGAIYIAQDVEMFDMSLRDNLTMGQQVDDEILVELLTAVGLKDWLDSQSEGLDVILGERGVFVSTGQRQRLNLVRGLLVSNREIYLLDEPTSNVDEETELKMIELIKEKLKGKTVIIVTHREKIQEICNRHYRFINGEIAEEK